MHFTAISQVRGSLTMETTGELSVEVPWDLLASTLILTPSLTLTQTSSPSFDVAILDSKDFMSGILSPVKLETMKFYIDSQWPRGLLIHLFVHKVKVSKSFLEESDFCSGLDGGTVRKELLKYVQKAGVLKNGNVTFLNTPPAVLDESNEYYQAFEEFLKFARCMAFEMKRGRFRLERVTSATPVGPAFHLEKKEIVNRIMEANGKKLILVGDPRGEAGEYRLCKPEESYVFCFDNCATVSFEAECGPKTSPGASKKTHKRKPPPEHKPERRYERSEGISIRSKHTHDPKTGKTKDGFESTVYIRSVQDMIYHLGQILRYQEKSNDFIEVDEAKLFHLTTDKDEADVPYISVPYNGQTYYAPNGKDYQTSDALILLIQLIGLYKEAKDLPKTNAVQTVGN